MELRPERIAISKADPCARTKNFWPDPEGRAASDPRTMFDAVRPLILLFAQKNNFSDPLAIGVELHWTLPSVLTCAAHCLCKEAKELKPARFCRSKSV